MCHVWRTGCIEGHVYRRNVLSGEKKERERENKKTRTGGNGSQENISKCAPHLCSVKPDWTHKNRGQKEMHFKKRLNEEMKGEENRL